MGDEKLNNQNSQGPHPALISIRDLQVEPSPYLQSRILAAHRDKSNQVQKWYYFFAGSLLSALTVALLFVMARPAVNSVNVASFKTGQAYLLKVELKSLGNKEVAYAEVEILGDSFEFFSESHGELSEQTKLVFEWEQLNRKDYLPIVIRGRKMGVGKMLVSFYNSRNEKIDSRVVPIQFGDKI